MKLLASLITLLPAPVAKKLTCDCNQLYHLNTAHLWLVVLEIKPGTMESHSESLLRSHSLCCLSSPLAANLHGGLSSFFGKIKGQLTSIKGKAGPGEEKGDVSQDDSLWTNISGCSRDYVFGKQSYNSDSQSAECLTEHSAFYNDSKDNARLQIYSADFPAELLKFFKGKKELFSANQGIANSTWDLKTELYLLKI